MSLIAIDGISEDSLVKTDVKAKDGGFRPFPCDANGWTEHTATVMKASLKTFTKDGKASDNISVVIANGSCGGELLFPLNINDIAPGLTPEKAEKARQGNLESLKMIIKILGCHTSGKLDTGKLDKAHGQLVKVIAKHKGFRQYEGRDYHKIGLILKGAIEDSEWKDVDLSIGLPPLPGSQPAASTDGGFDDLPF